MQFEELGYDFNNQKMDTEDTSAKAELEGKLRAQEAAQNCKPEHT